MRLPFSKEIAMGILILNKWHLNHYREFRQAAPSVRCEPIDSP